jgi:nitric oxide reductase subunit B
MHQPLMEMFVWLRMPGDIVFSVGLILLAVFVAKLWLGGRRPAKAPVDARIIRSSAAG